jgi:hypothetical protein
MPDETNLKISQEAFTRMVIIRLRDEFTRQVFLLTPDEAADLSSQLSNFQLEGVGEDFPENESTRLRALYLYNGHSLPVIDREKYRQTVTITSPPFDFELTQRIKNDQGQVVATKVVGVI